MSLETIATVAPAPAPPTVAPGWYPNPEAPGQRYWNGSAWTDSYAPPTSPATAATDDATKRRGTWGIVSGIFAALSIFLFPIVFGPAAIVCAGVSLTRGERGAKGALISAVLCMLAGMAFGAYVWTHNGA